LRRDPRNCHFHSCGVDQTQGKDVHLVALLIFSQPIPR
jgi:hypothetical protein